MEALVHPWAINIRLCSLLCPYFIINACTLLFNLCSTLCPCFVIDVCALLFSFCSHLVCYKLS
jgi:hypothetical protein